VPAPENDDDLFDQVADLVNATNAASDPSLPAVAQDAAASAADTLSTQLRPE
jgi:hypothetical protein